MAGGLLNIISVGNNNIFLTGNPTKTFFKVVYSKYTNFGLQKFRIDYGGQRDLRLTEPSTFTFKMPRYAELLMDTYLVLSLPNIWSPLYPPKNSTGVWAPYDFRWIRDIGTHIIKEISITCGSQIIQKYSGEYLHAMMQRDFSYEKIDLVNRMSGNVVEINDPANSYGHLNTYPSVYYNEANLPDGEEPSVRGREIYIPINTSFTLNSKCAFPLISLQYNELYITVELRPIQELFQVRDVFDISNSFPYVQPDFNLEQFQMYRFLQTPPSVNIDTTSYTNQIKTWNSDIHLISTYCFLEKEEAKLFASEEQIYLVKDVYEYHFENIVGTTKIKLPSSGMVSSWMWYLQRNDVNLRNEWSNYTNWPYRSLPYDIMPAPSTTNTTNQNDLKYNYDKLFNVHHNNYGPLNNPNGIDNSPIDIIGSNTGLYITNKVQSDNQYGILNTMGILLNGDYRENILSSGIYNYIEKYTRTQGAAQDGLYCYNFCLNTSPFDYQPSGAINLSKFRTIELELTTFVPQIDYQNSNIQVICDGTGNPVGINKLSWKLFEYNFNMTLFEERYNILSFIGGNCGMLYAR
jgi:hypothetical protein